MKRKITLKNENETIVIENDSIEVIAKELVDKYTTKHNGFCLEHTAIIYRTNYILDYSELDKYELMLFATCLAQYIIKKESEDAVIIYTFLKDKYIPTFARIN